MSEPIIHTLDWNQLSQITETLRAVASNINNTLININSNLNKIQYQIDCSNNNSMLEIYKLQEENKKLRKVFEEYSTILKLEDIK
jgi:predicted transcriptional regulator with HTH domain